MGVDCSAQHVHAYALSMLQSAAAEGQALLPGQALPIGLFLERERSNKDVSQQIFNKVCSCMYFWLRENPLPHAALQPGGV